MNLAEKEENEEKGEERVMKDYPLISSGTYKQGVLTGVYIFLKNTFPLHLYPY